ncbi:NAD(P)/FAD-dependent oxidoreductase [Kaistella faecalis]|uniref:NAD(P)/FAD-dependent oxidoreductase n=1 Tax=Kaistella faecalis TaxID=2852098 RepID=UPI001C473BD9|nr:FAD-binding oxidoreductase [Chryseobacterium faecale]UFK97273.1 FAD-binding oxidoreductase [Chryseobacterium faecale]
MKNVDYIIVGGGYAGIFFAHQLILNSKSFVIFSEDRKSASEVSAGIVNPVVLKKFTTFWLAKEQIDFLKATLDEIAGYTGKNYLINENIHRIFHDQKEQELWLTKSDTDELKPFLNTEFKSLGTILNSFGAGSVNLSARLNVEGFFNDFKAFFIENNHLREDRFDYSKISGNTYDDISFKHIVFCEGIGVKHNPFFSEIPVVANKGHHLKVKLSEPLGHQLTLKKKHFLFPLNEEIHYYGGTYDPNERGDEDDEFAKQQLIDGLSEFYPHSFEIKEVNYGFRPTVKDRRPILGSQSEHSNLYVFNGLGARGILNGCYFSKELFEHIEIQKPLMPEVDLKRFTK